MNYISIIAQLILSLSILVVLHEFGHYLPAKAFKTRVEKFYLFFDVKFSLFKKKIGDTVYGIGWLPLGGYVKISGMIDESMDTEQMAQEPQPWEFRSKPAWQRLIIMLGGVTVNFILAYVIYVFASLAYGGIDIKGQTGDPIYSTGKGKAFIGKPNSGFGTWVIVDHGNGLQTYYGHMSDHLITNGQDVEAGTLIGRVGSTGISTGPHLHYQIMVNGQSVDPENNNPIQLKDYTFAKFGLLAIPENQDTTVPSAAATPTSPTVISSPAQMGTIDPSKTTFNDLTKEQQDKDSTSDIKFLYVGIIMWGFFQ